MPKRVQGRSAKSKNRARRPQTRLDQTAPPVPAEQTDTPAVSRPTPAPAVARRPAARRMPVTTVNYGYLRHDLRLLAIIEPSMVILLVVAYIVFHGI